MDKFKVLLAAFCLTSGSLATAANKMECPTPDFIKNWEDNNGRGFTRTKMYRPMVEGSTDYSRQMVIVDENDWGNRQMLNSYPEMNESLFKHYDDDNSKKGLRGAYSKSYAHKGIFKIAYRYNATECRRQIILGKHIRKKGGEGTGTYNGFTAIEICNPDIAKLFVLAKSRLGAGNMRDIDAFIGFVAALMQAGKIDSKTYYQIKDNLSMNRSQKTAVMFYKDGDGDILPRFAVKINKFWWQEFGNSCMMTIDHKDAAQDYAGLKTSFSQDYSWEMLLEPETPSDRTLWYWDEKTMQPGAVQGTSYNYVEVVDAL